MLVGLACRVGGDKGLKKTGSFPKKNQNHINTISPQPLHTEKSSLHDKSLHPDKGKFHSPERATRGDDRGLSLPEVKGAADGSSSDLSGTLSDYSDNTPSPTPSWKEIFSA